MSWKEKIKNILSKQSSPTQKQKKLQDKETQTKTKGKHYTGVETQFRNNRSDLPHKQLIVGLDFGTAFTKVVVGEERARFTVPFKEEETSIDDYLLASTFWVSPEGVCTLDRKHKDQRTDLKFGLLSNKRSEESIIQSIAYLSLVLRSVRSYILNHKQELYSTYYIDWLLNVGLPTGSYHNRRLTRLYKNILNISWLTSTIPDDVSIKTIKKLIKDKGSVQSKTANKLHPEAISVFPEFVAQLTGYVRSPLRQPDLHLLVDIGAGTFDVTVFNIHEREDEDKFPIFAKAIKPLGTRFLVRHRIKGSSLKESGELSPFVPVPTNRRFSELLGINAQRFKQIDRPFREKLVEIVGDLLKSTKSRRYPLSRHWETGIPIFLCGGGASCEFYRALFFDNNSIGGFGVIEKRLPKPDSLIARGVEGSNYDRLSVAYGLSFDPFDIGEIIRSDKIPDVTESESTAPSTSTTPESSYAVCPRCNGTGGLHTPCDRCGGSGFA
jgi:hypothetical protein